MARDSTGADMRRIIYIGLAIALAGCEEGGDPKSGNWNFVAGAQTQNTCNYDGVGGQYGDFTLDNNGGSLTIDPQDGSDPFECDLDGNDFDCPERFQGEQDVATYDATLIIHASARGSFDSNTTAAGTQHGSVTCEGGDCGALANLVGATVPCEFTEEFTASYAD
jgi:hypothetical protein